MQVCLLAVSGPLGVCARVQISGGAVTTLTLLCSVVPGPTSTDLNLSNSNNGISVKLCNLTACWCSAGMTQVMN